MREVRAALLAGGLGERMGRLTDRVCKPLVPFAAACRLVDFSVDNARRSGIPEVVLLSQHREHALVDHLLRHWDDPGRFGVHFGPHDAAVRQAMRVAAPGRGLPPGVRLGPRPPEQGTADALPGAPIQAVPAVTLPGRPVVDTNGAGDSYVAAFLHAVLRGESWQAAAVAGAVAGAYACGTAGTHSSFIDAERLQAELAASATRSATIGVAGVTPSTAPRSTAGPSPPGRSP